jgi:heavy metal sensor kinase
MRVSSTIRLRLTAWYLLLLTVVFCVLGLLLHAYLGYTLRGSLDRSLAHRSDQLVAIRDLPQAMAEGRFAADPGEVVAFFDAHGRPLRVAAPTAIDDAVSLAWIEAALRQGPAIGTGKGQDGRSLRFYVASYAAADAPTALAVARPMDNILAAQHALLQTLLVVGPLTLLLSAGGGLFLARRALRPIDRMVQTVREIEETDLAGRIDVRSDDELGRLGRTLNDMLDRLQRAFTRQRQFTADASHELRTPLSVIEAEATLALRRERRPEDYRDALATIAEEVTGMDRLIDQLLSLARADEGGGRLVVEPVDLAALAVDVTGEMRLIGEERGVAVRSATDRSLIVRGDSGQLRRLVVNLVENAVRYTDAGGAVDVSVRLVDNKAVLTVGDTGIGISPDHISHIFERFYRVAPARSRSDGGAGLGLALCKAIVDAHGGSIEIESKVGVGTIFTVHLPTS